MRPRSTIALILGVALLFSLLFYETIRDIALICWNDEDYSHGLILPLISAYLIWEKRDALALQIFGASKSLPATPAFSIVGLLFLFFGIALLLTGTVSQNLFFTWLGFFPALIGTLQLLLGTAAASGLVAPIVLLFMAKPIPDSLVPLLFFPLQVFAAKVSAWFLNLLDVPVYLVGNIIEIPNMKLMVEEACSGIRSLMALLCVASIVILVVPMRTWAKWFILLISVLTAIALNVVRVAATGVLAHFYDPAAATGFFHTFSGMVVFIVGLVIVYGIANLVSTETPKPKQPRAT